MGTSRVLFISGSIGLGHADRDVAIARALRALNPSVEISWLAGDPARQLIADAGEVLLPCSVADETASAEQIAGHFALNVAQYAWRAQRLEPERGQVQAAHRRVRLRPGRGR